MISIKNKIIIILTILIYNVFKKPNVVFTGCRDGKLRMFDLRFHGSNSRYGIGPMINQNSPICHLKQIGAWYILSDGMNGSVCIISLLFKILLFKAFIFKSFLNCL